MKKSKLVTFLSTVFASVSLVSVAYGLDIVNLSRLTVNDCRIQVGENSCIATGTYANYSSRPHYLKLINSTTGVTTTGVVQPGNHDGTIPTYVLGEATTLRYGLNNLAITDNVESSADVVIASATATASCVVGATWNGSTCVQTMVISSMPTPITPIDTGNTNPTDTADTASFSCFQLTRSLVFGSKDSTTNGQVSDLQFFLSNKGYLRTDPTGYFGVATLAAVKAFQSDNGITPNGVVGPLTRAKIVSLTCTNDEPTEINPQNTWDPRTGGTTNNGNTTGTTGATSQTAIPTTSSLPQAINGLSVNLSFTGTGANGIPTSVSGGGMLQNVDPMRIRTWTWNSTGAAAVSARYVLSGANCNASSFSNVSEENWQPWSGTGVSGTRFSGSSSRVLGQAYFGCTLTATYTARNTSGGVVASTVRISFRGAGVSANLPDSNPLYYCNGVIQHEPCISTGGTSGGSSTSGPTGPIMTCLYAAPRPGCTYVPGPNYNPASNCGMVESCTATTPGTTDTPGTTLNLTPSSLPTGSLYSLYASCPSNSNSFSMKIEYQSNGQYVSRGCMNVTSYTTSAINAGQEIGTAPGSLVPQTFPTGVGVNNYRLTCYSGSSCSGSVTATKNTPLTITSSGSAGGTGGTGTGGSNCQTGTTLVMAGGAPFCGPVGGVCPTGTTPGTVSGVSVCNPTTGSGSGTGTTGGSGSSGPTATGISCYRDDLYNNGTLSMTCPKAPNGGIACQVSPSDSSKTGCAGDGFVWINGNRIQWRGNTSGACYADSACETNYVCGTVSKRCEAKVQNSWDYGVTGAPNDGGAYKRTWGGTSWGAWVFVNCLPGYHEDSPGRCVSDQRACSMPNAPGVSNYNKTTSTWGACQYKYYPGSDRVQCNDGYIWGNETVKCIQSTRSCTPYNPYPSSYPRGSSVATADERWDATFNGTGGWGQCEITCKSGYSKQTLYAETMGLEFFQITPSITSTALDYCTPSYDTLVDGDLSIPPIVTTDYKVSWSTDTGGTSKTTSCKVNTGKSTCDLTATWSSRNATSGSLTKNGTPVGTNGTSGSYRFTIQPTNTDTLVLTLQPGNIRRTNTVIAECESGSNWNGSTCAATTGGGGGTGGGVASGSISGGRCTISIGMSSCAASVSWTSSNASTVSVNKFNQDGGGSSLLSNERNGATTITGLVPSLDGRYPFVRLQAEPGPTGPARYSVNLIAECAAGSTWNGSTCAPTTGGGGGGTVTPTVSISASPSSAVYPTTIRYSLSSTNASSCSVVGSDGRTYVSSSENVSSKTLSSLTTPGTLSLTAICYSGPNGSGQASAPSNASVTVSCPTGQTWNGTACVTTGGGGGTVTASCSASMFSSDFFQTQESRANITSSGVARVEQSTNGGPWLPFSVSNGAQVFAPMYFAPGAYTTQLRGVLLDGSANISCTPASVSFTVKP